MEIPAIETRGRLARNLPEIMFAGSKLVKLRKSQWQKRRYLPAPAKACKGERLKFFRNISI